MSASLSQGIYSIEVGRGYLTETSDIACLVLHTTPGSAGSCWCQGCLWTLAALAPVHGHRPVPSSLTAHFQDRPEQCFLFSLRDITGQTGKDYIHTLWDLCKKRALDIPPQDRHISAGLKQVGTRLDTMKKVIGNYVNKVLFSHKQPKLRCVWARAAAIEMNTLPRTCLENFKIDDDQHRYTAGGVCDWSFCSGTRGAWVCSPQDLGWVTGNHSCIPCMSKGGSGQGPGPSSVSARLYYLAFGIDVPGRCLSVGPRSRAALESSPAGPSLTPCL